MNNFEPDRKTLGDLFRQSKRLIIPRYQRSYEWKDANISDFYSDFVATAEESLNFLGNIVVDASSSDSYEVIDGQQRLVTLTILCAVIRDILKEELKDGPAYALAEGIDSTFLKMGTSFSDIRQSGYKLTPSKDLEEFFMFYIQDGGDNKRKAYSNKFMKAGHKNVVNAYKLFRKLLSEEKLSGNHNADQKVEFLRKTVERLENISIIIIEVYDQEAAYAIFESFNAKRVDLSVADLVKNYYFSKIKGPEDLVQRKMDRWDVVISRTTSLPGGKIDRFLHYYFQSREGRFPKSQLYRKIRYEIDVNHDKFMDNLEKTTLVYSQLKDCNVENGTTDPIPYDRLRKINASLEGINKFNVEQCFILLISVLINRRMLSPTHLVSIVLLIENFTFLYSKIANGQANVLESIYGDFAKKLHEDSMPDKPEIYGGQYYSLLFKAFQKQMPSFDVFESNFKELDYEKPQDKKLIKYIFEKTEIHNSRGGTMLGDLSNIDHIFPQNPPPGIRPPKSVHKIGNLIPIDQITNSKIGNQLPSEKVSIYRNITNITQISDYLSFIKNYGDEITDELINIRGAELAKKAYYEIFSSK